MSKSLRYAACVLVNLFVVLAACRPAAAAARDGPPAEIPGVSPENLKNGLAKSFSAVYQLFDDLQILYEVLSRGPCDENTKVYWTYFSGYLKDTLESTIDYYRKSLSSVIIPRLGVKDFVITSRDGSMLKTLRFEQIVLRGLENSNLKTYDVDFCDKSTEIEISLPKLELTAMYELDGYVNTKGPITGVGNLTINVNEMSIHSMACGKPESSLNAMCNSWKTMPKNVTVNITGMNFMNLTDAELNEKINHSIADMLQHTRETQLNATKEQVQPNFKLPSSFL